VPDLDFFLIGDCHVPCPPLWGALSAVLFHFGTACVISVSYLESFFTFLLNALDLQHALFSQALPFNFPGPRKFPDYCPLSPLGLSLADFLLIAKRLWCTPPPFYHWSVSFLLRRAFTMYLVFSQGGNCFAYSLQPTFLFLESTIDLSPCRSSN